MNPVDSVAQIKKKNEFLRTPDSPSGRTLELAGMALLKEAKRSKAFCLGIARALLDRNDCFQGTPKLGNAELVAAIQLTDKGMIRWPRHSFGYLAWLEARECFVTFLRFQTHYRTPLTGKHVRMARRVLKAAPPILLGRYNELLSRDLEIIEAELNQSNKFLSGHSTALRNAASSQTYRRGRRLDEHKQRIVTTVELLNSCGYFDPERKVSRLLAEFNESMKRSDIRRLVASYDKAKQGGRRADCLIPRDKLLEYWLPEIAYRREWRAKRLAAKLNRVGLYQGAFARLI